MAWEPSIMKHRPTTKRRRTTNSVLRLLDLEHAKSAVLKFSGLAFFRNRRTGRAVKNLAGALHADRVGCTLSGGREVKMEIPVDRPAEIRWLRLPSLCLSRGIPIARSSRGHSFCHPRRAFAGERALKGGAVDLLRKPVRREALLNAVHVALQQNSP